MQVYRCVRRQFVASQGSCYALQRVEEILFRGLERDWAGCQRGLQSFTKFESDWVEKGPREQGKGQKSPLSISTSGPESRACSRRMRNAQCQVGCKPFLWQHPAEYGPVGRCWPDVRQEAKEHVRKRQKQPYRNGYRRLRGLVTKGKSLPPNFCPSRGQSRNGCNRL